MMPFITWLEAKKVKISRDDRTQFLSLDDRDIGSMVLSKEGDERVANRMFPGLLKPGERVGRIHGVSVEDDLQGFGLGQLLYLRSFDKGGADWYYNSQTYPPATNVLKSLSGKGYIELHWYPREPNWNESGGIHLVRITEKGRQAYRKGEMVKKAELSKHKT